MRYTKKQFEIEVKNKYPVGCKIDQETAYGIGDVFTINSHKEEQPYLIY